MNNPYDTPNTVPQIDSELKEFPKFRKLAITGIILLTGPFFGLLGTVIGMIRAFGDLLRYFHKDSSIRVTKF